MTLEKQLGSILKKLKNTVTNIIEIEGTVNSRAENVDTINKDVQAKAEEMKKYVDTMNASVNTLNTLETQISDLKTSISSTTDRAEKMLKETQAIRDTLTDALVWKGSVENYAALPTKNVRVGDTYNVTAADSAHNINAGDNVVWDGSKWDVMGGIMNVDSLAVKGQDANFKDVTATTFHGALNGKADSATTADVAKTVAWNNIGGKPATFPSDIQLDDVPTEGSANAVKSSGIKSALDEKISTAGGTLTGNLELSDSNVAISTKGGAISGGDTSISLSSKGTVDFTDSNTGTRTSYISTSDGKYHGDVIGNADRATLAVNDDAGNNIADTYAKKTDLPTVPTKVSAFTNDAGYLTSHQSLAGYASLSKANSYTGVNTFGGATQLNETKIYGTTSFYANNAVAATIAGNQFSGNAATATKATNDGNGANIATTYLKKAGDTATGKITFASTNLNTLPEVKKTSDDNMSGVRFSSKTKFLGAVGKRLSNGEDLLNLRSDNNTTDVVLDSRNYNNYAPTKTGTGASGTWPINISGNAASATTADKATADANGNELADPQKYMHVYYLSGDTDLNDVKTTGIYTCTEGGNKNKPVVSCGVLRVYLFHNNVEQEFIPDNGPDLFVRHFDGDTWYAWSKLNAGNADYATNADTVDDIHADSLFYNKGNWNANNWATIGTYQVNNNPPASDAYGWGQVISSSTNDARFQLYATDQLLDGNGRLHYRTGWDDSKHSWNTILDSENYNLFAPTKTGGGASGTWGISITGNAASATTADNADTSAAINYSSQGTNYIKVGSTNTGDAANKTANMVIGSWYGITFYNVCGDKIAGGMNVRDGSLTMKGTITGSKVYNAVYNDYAEFFEKDENITFEAGDIVALDTSSEEERYIKATEDSIVVVGVCTHEYAHIIGGKGHGRHAPGRNCAA